MVKQEKKRLNEEPLSEQRVKRERTDSYSDGTRRLSLVGGDVPDSLQQPAVAIEDTEPSIIYQVSSRHLISASPKFRDKLVGRSGDRRKQADGLYHLTTFDWDPEALSIFLNIIHLRHRQVAKQLTLEMLAKVAVLVDHYECWEAFDLISSIWINDVRSNYAPRFIYDRDLMLWMIISWVFKLPVDFANSTHVAIMQNRQPLVRDMGLSIPQPILNALEDGRSQAIEQMVSLCYNWIDRFMGDYNCEHGRLLSYACSCMLLGALTMHMGRLHLSSPRPTAPFEGWSFDSITAELNSLRSPRWGSSSDGFSHVEHRCSFVQTLIPEANTIWRQVQGLKLDDFKDRTEETSDLAGALPT